MVRLPPGSRALSASFPTVANPQAVVAVTVDSMGRLLLYGERRGPPLRAERRADMRPSQAAAALRAAIDSNRSTTISFDTRRNRATLMNQGGGGPTQSVGGPINQVVRLEKVGHPLVRARRVIAACR